MATHTTITLICDKCGREDSPEQPVTRHRAKVDSDEIVNVDACARCWHKAADAFLALLATGESEPGTRRWRL